MADKKIIAVVGATGAQGSGLVRAILSDPSGGFVARALTRDVNSDKAKELSKLGAEVVAADVYDEESLKLAFKGAYGVYCVTFFWAHFSPEKEMADGIFKKGREYAGKTVGIAGEHLTGARMAASFTAALGQEVRYKEVSPEVYRSFGFPGAEDLGNMFQFKRDFEQVFCGARNLEVARALNPALQTFDKWLARNKSRIPLE